jgi:hypothetical protein
MSSEHPRLQPPLPRGVIGVTAAEYEAVLRGEMPERLSREYFGDAMPRIDASPLQEDDDGATVNKSRNW